MKLSTVSLAAGFLVLTASTGFATPLSIGSVLQTRTALLQAEIVRFDSSLDFRRCMREKYGPRYFARVRRATRFFMAQACGG